MLSTHRTSSRRDSPPERKSSLGSERRRRRLAAAFTAGIVVLALLAAAEILSARSGSSVRRAPTLPGSVLHPPPVSLPALRGEPALVAFWASWCGPCHEDAPALRRAARRLRGRARVVAVDWDDSGSAARAFLRRYRWQFTVLADGSGAVGERYGIAGLPTTFVLSSAGEIVATLRGPQTAEDLERAALSAS